MVGGERLSRVLTLANAVRDRIRGIAPLESASEGIDSIVSDAIVVRKIDDWNRSDRRGFQNEDLPGVFVPLPRRARRPKGTGDNHNDYVAYIFDIVIAFKDNHELDLGMSTVPDWEEAICDELQSRASLTAYQAAQSTIYHVHCDEILHINEQSWEDNELWRGGVQLTLDSWEPRT